MVGMSWQNDLELAKALMEDGAEPITYTQALKVNISLITGVHDRLDGIAKHQVVRDGTVDKNAVNISRLEGKVNVGIGLTALVGLAGAISLFI